MSIVIPVLAALLLCHAALSSLCLAMDRHHAQVFGRKPAAWLARALRVAGWSLLSLALAYCGRHWGWAIGPVAWFGFLSAAALALVFALPYAPRLTGRLAVASLAAGLVLMFS